MWDDFEYERYVEDKIIEKHEKHCATCEHEADDSGYCLECYYGGKWQRKGGVQE